MSAIKIRTMTTHSFIEHISLWAAVSQRCIPECFAPYFSIFSPPPPTNERRTKHASCAHTSCLLPNVCKALTRNARPSPCTRRHAHHSHCISARLFCGTFRPRRKATAFARGRQGVHVWSGQLSACHGTKNVSSRRLSKAQMKARESRGPFSLQSFPAAGRKPTGLSNQPKPTV